MVKMMGLGAISFKYAFSSVASAEAGSQTTVTNAMAEYQTACARGSPAAVAVSQ
jgi:hypothetical protein